MDPVACFLDAAFEHIGHPQLLRDFRQILRGAVVMRSRCPRDYPQPTDPRQGGDNFILDTLGEKRVLLV